MYLLITTAHFVLGYDTGAGNVDVLASGGGFYGLTWDPLGTQIALTHDNYEGEIKDLADSAMADCGYVSVGGRRSWPFLNSPHQALWVDKDFIVVTNTGRNAVARVAVDDLSVVQVRYDRAIWDRFDRSGAAGGHYNSIFYDGTHIYFVAHNFALAAFIVKAAWPSLDLVERTLVPGTSGIHNLWIDEERRWVSCDSNRGSLIDARTGELLWDSRGEGYTRGLAVTDDLIIVGNSEKSQRAKRDFTASGIWLVDRATRALRDYILLGHFGAVHDVRISDMPDVAHHGRPLNPKALASLRDSKSPVRMAKLERARAKLPDPRRWWPRIGVFLIEGGMEIAKDGQLAVMTSRESGTFSDGRIDARLHVHKWGSAGHADLVLRYSGPDDHSMYAAVFQSNGAGALTASVWIENGGWTCIESVAISGLLLARFDLRKEGLPVAFVGHGKSLRVEVGGELVLQVDDTRLAAGAAGLRMAGEAFGISAFSKSID